MRRHPTRCDAIRRDATPSDAIRRHQRACTCEVLYGPLGVWNTPPLGTIGPISIADVRRPSLWQESGGWAIRGGNQRAIRGGIEGGIEGGIRGRSEGPFEGHQRGQRKAIEGTHAPSEVESIATPRAFVWRIRVRSSQVAGRLIRRHTLHRGYHVVIVATSVVVRDEEESLVPAGARTCHIRKAYEMSVRSSGN